MKETWKRVKKGENPLLKVYVSNRGNVRADYPKAPKWAQDVAVLIWKDIEKGGQPTKKGVKDCVRGLWAAMIDQAARNK